MPVEARDQCIRPASTLPLFEKRRRRWRWENASSPTRTLNMNSIARHAEAALEPKLEIVDSHHHLWTEHVAVSAGSSEGQQAAEGAAISNATPYSLKDLNHDLS